MLKYVIITLAALLVLGVLSVTARANDVSLSQQLGITNATCPAGQSINDLRDSYDPAEDVQLYPYGGQNAVGLIAALTANIGATPPGDPKYLVLGVIPGQPAGAFVYLFDANGCFDVEAAFQTKDLQMVFAAAGLALPYGATFFGSGGSL